MLNAVEINTQYDKGIRALSNISFNRYARELYGVQSAVTEVDDKLLLLLHALESWDTRIGASNLFSSQQLLAVMDCIYKLSNQPVATKALTDKGSVCGTAGSTNTLGSLAASAPSLAIVDTLSVDLTLANNLLSALVKVSGQAGNTLVLNADGLYTTGGAGTPQDVRYINGGDFVGVEYHDASLAGKDILVWHRGLGYLTYDPDNPDSPDNEFIILPTGGFRITIPGFDVNAGVNHFYVSTTTYA